MKSDQWKKDREALRKIAKDKELKGEDATLVYCLISHMRGKLHMTCYNKYSGGWRKYTSVPKDKQVAILSREYHRAYGTEYVKTYYYMQAIEDLADQADWIEKYMQRAQEATQTIAQRVLAGYPEVEETQDVSVPQLAEQPAS